MRIQLSTINPHFTVCVEFNSFKYCTISKWILEPTQTYQIGRSGNLTYVVEKIIKIRL